MLPAPPTPALAKYGVTSVLTSPHSLLTAGSGRNADGSSFAWLDGIPGTRSSSTVPGRCRFTPYPTGPAPALPASPTPGPALSPPAPSGQDAATREVPLSSFGESLPLVLGLDVDAYSLLLSAKRAAWEYSRTASYSAGMRLAGSGFTQFSGHFLIIKESCFQLSAPAALRDALASSLELNNIYLRTKVRRALKS